MEDDFKNQYLYFNYDSSKYPFITSILSEDPIFKINEYIPKLNEFINSVQYEMNMRYTKEEINNIKIDKKFKKDIEVFNQFIEKNKNIFGQNKKIEENAKIFEIINLPGSIINSVYTKIIEIYNEFVLKMNFIDKNIIDKVVIQEAKKNDYYFNYEVKDKRELTIEKKKLEELILLYSKRVRIKDNKINVYDGGKIIYNYEKIEKKLVEQFIFGKKLFKLFPENQNQKQKTFIYSSEIFEQEANIIKEFENIYKQVKISDDNKQKMENYINARKKIKEENILNLFYELYFLFKYVTQISPSNIKIQNLNDLKQYFELKQYKFIQLNDAIETLKDNLSINSILYFYELVIIFL